MAWFKKIDKDGDRIHNVEGGSMSMEAARKFAELFRLTGDKDNADKLDAAIDAKPEKADKPPKQGL